MNTSPIFFETEIFYGSWQVSRLVVDYHSSLKGSYKGEMTLSYQKLGRSDQHMPIRTKFIDKGKLKYNNQSYDTSQFYYVDFYSNKIVVLFANEKPFFCINKTELSQKIFHRCNGDQYYGCISFISKKCFSLNWKVSGPRKKYYTRVIYKKLDRKLLAGV